MQGSESEGFSDKVRMFGFVCKGQWGILKELKPWENHDPFYCLSRPFGALRRWAWTIRKLSTSHVVVKDGDH